MWPAVGLSCGVFCCVVCSVVNMERCETWMPYKAGIS
jgi:hypothetical protein